MTAEPLVGPWESRLRLWISVAGHNALGPGKVRLLTAIDATKSLSAAAKQLGMSYRLAWKHLRLIEEWTGRAVVEPHRGGPDGGGTVLTAQGKALLAAYCGFRNEVETQARCAFSRYFATWSNDQMPEPTPAAAPDAEGAVPEGGPG